MLGVQGSRAATLYVCSCWQIEDRLGACGCVLQRNRICVSSSRGVGVVCSAATLHPCHGPSVHPATPTCNALHSPRQVPIPDHIDMYLLDREIPASDMTALQVKWVCNHTAAGGPCAVRIGVVVFVQAWRQCGDVWAAVPQHLRQQQQQQQLLALDRTLKLPPAVGSFKLAAAAACRWALSRFASSEIRQEHEQQQRGSSQEQR